MQLDWFTFLAQIVNFLILVYLLQRFLYGHIVKIADEREEQIASRFAEAETQAEEAQAEAAAYRQKRQEFEQERDKMITQVHQQAEARRHELMDVARQEVEEQKSKWYHALAREKQAFLQALQQQAGRQVYAVARRALADLADAELEQQVVGVFMDRLRRLSQDEKEKLAISLQEAGDKSVQVQSAFALPADRQQAIQMLLHDHFDDDVSVRFSTNADLICGVALRVDGRQVTWNVQSYLDRLEEEVVAALEEELRGVHEEDSVAGRFSREAVDG